VVVAPLSVVDHWQKEFEKYATSVKTLRYIGEKEEREELRGKLKKRDPSVEFNVLITTPELLLADSEFLQRYKWRYGIVDEAHRLKNPYVLWRRVLHLGLDVQRQAQCSLTNAV
jgi:SNF2 family DNA or RNA helicase